MIIVLLGVALSALTVLASGLVTAPTAAAATDLPKPTASKGFSAPLWMPLRKAATIGCAKDNCTVGSHKYWALDFLGKRGDPVYAAGAGIAHIGGNPGSGCVSGKQVSGKNGVDNGKWIWIDHGGGMITRYHHLNSITIKNGERVTPATKIGSMGHSGDKAPCKTDYLHFEIRTDGLTGPRVAIPRLAFCVGSTKKMAPDVYGSTSWNSRSINRKQTVAGGDGCLDADWTKTPARPTVSVRPGNERLTLNWGRPPAGTTQVVVRVERYSTALRGYGRPYHYAYSGTSTGVTLKKLTNGRNHKIVVAFRNAYGYSSWSTLKNGKPGAPPTKGGSARYLTWPHGKYVHYGWNRSKDNGSAIYRYEVAIRCRSGATYGAWKAHVMPNTKDVFYNFTGLGKANTCQVRVHAKNAYGWGAWSSARTVSK